MTAVKHSKAATKKPAKGALAQLLDDAPAPPAASPTAMLLHRQIIRDPSNPRRDFDSDGALEALDELRQSIVADDLLENLVVRPVGGETTEDGLQLYMLIAGERRWRAIGLAIADDDWAADRPIACNVRIVDEATARRLALVENLQRRDLNYMEEARSLQQLCELEDKPASQVGEELGFTGRWGQQRIQLLQLSEPLQARLENRHLKLEDARAILGAWEKLTPIMREELERGAADWSTIKARLDAMPKPLALKTEEWVLILEVYDKVQRSPLQDGGSYTEIHADGRFDETAKTFSSWPHYLLGHVSHIRDKGGETGRFQISVGHEAKRQLERRFGPIATERDRLRILDELYAELGEAHTPGPLYRTAWLNEPFEISDSLRAEIENARKAEAEREAGWAIRRAEQEAERQRASELQRVRQEARDANAKAARKLARGIAQDDVAAALKILSDEHPLPWTFHEETDDEQGGLKDAAGEWVLLGETGTPADLMTAVLIGHLAGTKVQVREGARNRLVQVVAGFLVAEEPEDIDADCDRAFAAAEVAVDAYLEKHDLTAAEAEELDSDVATKIVAEARAALSTGEQIDLEAAIAATPADDVDLSPALVALANGTARPIAAADADLDEAAA